VLNLAKFFIPVLFSFLRVVYMSRLAVVAIIVAGVLAAAVLQQYVSVSGDIATEVGLSTWWWRVPVYVYVYANLINAYRIIGTNPWVSLFIDYSSQMNPDFSDVRFVYNGNYMGTYWRFVFSTTSANVYVQLPSDSKAVVTPYTFYMYYGNPNAKMWGQSNVPAIGFAWRDWESWYQYDLLEANGVNLPYTAGYGILAVWIRADGSTYYRVSLAKLGGPVYLKVCLLRGIWDINYVNATSKDFYSYIYDVYKVACYDPTNVNYIDLAIPEKGWYTVSFTWAAGAFGFIDIRDLATNNMFGNAVDVVPMTGDKYRYWLVPVLWNSNYYSYSFGNPEPVAAAVPVVPTVVWNATVGGSYYEAGYVPRTVTVTVPFFTTVTTSIPVVVPPSTTITTTVYLPVTTITTWIPVEPTTITKTITVTVPRFISSVYTTTVTMPVKTPYTTVTSTVTTTASYTTIVNTTTTVTTITSTLVTSETRYTTITVTSPWRITQVSPYTTVTSTITTTIPVTTTVYETATVPVYYTETLTLSNTGTNALTATVPITAAVNGAEATYIYNNPVVIGAGAVTTTTAYWIVRSVETSTVTTTVGGVAGGVSWLGWVVLLVMLAVMGFAILYLVKRSRL